MRATQAPVPALSGRPNSERRARRKLWCSEYCEYTALIRANTPSSRGTSNSRCKRGYKRGQIRPCESMQTGLVTFAKSQNFLWAVLH